MSLAKELRIIYLLLNPIKLKHVNNNEQLLNSTLNAFKGSISNIS